MKILKGLVLTLVALGLTFTSVQAKDKAQFNDVDKDYWAYTEISSIVGDGVMAAKKGDFRPEDSVQRAEFTGMLLKVLGHDNMTVTTKNTFKDVTVNTQGYTDILKSKQLGLVYGYPSGNFLPVKEMNRAEVTSVMSHITKGSASDLSCLKQFRDENEIPAWGKYQYAKAVNLGLYVNHPDAWLLEPGRDITRAETAVLLYKLKNSLGNVQDKFLGKETGSVIGTEHLNVSKKAETNEVTVMNDGKVILAGNYLSVKFDELFKSKNANEGDVVSFVFDKDVYTQEGTLVIPAGSKLYADVTEIIPTKWFNKNARVGLHFNRLELANGKTVRFDGTVATKDEYLKEGPWETAGKLSAYTLGGTALGGGIGVAAGVPTKKLGRGLGIGLPVGAGVGLGAGLITKGLNFVGHEGDNVLVKVLSDVKVPN